jgi:hypothetical protein
MLSRPLHPCYRRGATEDEMSSFLHVAAERLDVLDSSKLRVELIWERNAFGKHERVRAFLALSD